MKNNILARSLFCVLISFLLLSCGGGEETSEPVTPPPTIPTPPPVTTPKNIAIAEFGGFVIENLKYSIGESFSGKTNGNGEFEYDTNDVITFTLGDYSFTLDSQSIEDSSVSAYQLFPSDALAATNLVRLLIALDSNTATSTTIELPDKSTIPENLDLTLTWDDFLAQFETAFQALIPSYTFAKLQADCALSQRCSLDELISISDQQEISLEQINEVNKQIDDLSIALMQAIISFNSYVYLDANHTDIELIKTRQADAIAAMNLLNSYSIQGVEKTNSALNSIASYRSKNSLSEGLDVILKNSSSGLSSLKDYFTSIKQATEDATFQLHQSLTDFTGDEESVNRWFQKAEDTAVFVKEASALSVTVLGTVYAAGTLTSVAVAEAGWATTSAMVVNGVASLDGIVSSASALIKTTKAGSDLFLGHGSQLAGYLSDNAVVNTITRADEVISMVSIIPGNKAEALSSIQYIAGQTTNLLYGNSVEFGDLSVNITEIPQQMFEAVVADHTTRAQIINQVQSTSTNLVNAGREAYNDFDAGLNEIFKYMQTQPVHENITQLHQEFLVAKTEATGLAKNALLPGNYLDHQTKEKVFVDELNNEIAEAIVDSLPEEAVNDEVKKQKNKQVWNETSEPIELVYIGDDDIQPYQDLRDVPTGGCKDGTLDDTEINETGSDCVYIEREQSIGIGFYENKIKTRTISYKSNEQSYSVEEKHFRGGTGPFYFLQEGPYYSKTIFADGSSHQKELFYHDQFVAGYIGTKTDWNEAGKIKEHVIVYGNDRAKLSRWEYEAQNPEDLKSYHHSNLQFVIDGPNIYSYPGRLIAGDTKQFVKNAKGTGFIIISDIHTRRASIDSPWHYVGKNSSYSNWDYDTNSATNINRLLYSCLFDNAGNAKLFSSFDVDFMISRNLYAKSASENCTKFFR